jgi:hypothetical protein
MRRVTAATRFLNLDASCFVLASSAADFDSSASTNEAKTEELIMC